MLRRGRDPRGPYYQWGDVGRKYYYSANNTDEREQAKRWAARSGQRIMQQGWREQSRRLTGAAVTSPGEQFTVRIRERMARTQLLFDLERERYLTSRVLIGGSRPTLGNIRSRVNARLRQDRLELNSFGNGLGRIFAAGYANATGAELPGSPDDYESFLAVKREFEDRVDLAQLGAGNSLRDLDKIRSKKPDDPGVNRQRLFAFTDSMERRIKYGPYMQMAARTAAQKAFALGTIVAAAGEGVEAFRVVDGPGCGWTQHSDPQQAHDMVVSAEDAMANPIAHPNCVRRFEPLPGVPKPPRGGIPPSAEQIQRRQEQLTQIAQQIGGVARAEAVAALKTSARNIAIDLALDRQFREMAWRGAITGYREFRDFSARTANFLRSRVARNLPDLTEDQIGDIITGYIDDYIENGATAEMPSWVVRILTGTDRPEPTVIMKKASDYTMYHDLRVRAGLTAEQLNAINSIEQGYGEFFMKRLAAMFPNDDVIGRIYAEFVRRYDVGPGQIVEKAGRAAGRRALGVTGPGRQSGRLPSGLGRITLPDTGRRGGPLLDRLAVRFQHENPLIRVQATTANRLRSYSLNELREIASARGVPIFRVVKEGVSGFDDVVEALGKDELLSMLGFDPGLLTHITIFPERLVRFGFKWDPQLGWRQPLPRFSVVPSRGPFRMRSELTKGRYYGDVWSDDAFRFRTISHEIYLVLGDNMGLSYGELGLPRLENIGARFTTLLGRMESPRDLRLYIQNRGLEGFLEDTQLFSVFAEMRLLGWRWMRIGHVFNLSAAQLRGVAEVTRAIWPDLRQTVTKASMFELFLRDLFTDREIFDRKARQIFTQLYYDEAFGTLESLEQRGFVTADDYLAYLLTQAPYNFSKSKAMDVLYQGADAGGRALVRILYENYQRKRAR